MFFKETNLKPEDWKTVRTVYFGIDPSKDFLHLGHILLIYTLSNIQKKYKLKAIIVLGDSTLQSGGDPSDKLETRMNIPNKEKILSNTENIKNNILRVSNNLGLNVNLLKNSTWLNSIDIIKFTSLILSKINLNSILKQSIFERRISNNKTIKLSEFIYPTLQAYDVYYLQKTLGTTLQIGGHDQLFNLKSGAKLIGKLLGQKSFYATLPLLTNNQKKISKTELKGQDISIYKSSPFSIWQFIRNIDDKSLSLYLNNFLMEDYKIEDYNQEKIKVADFLIKLLYNESILKYIYDLLDLIHNKKKIDISYKNILGGNIPTLISKSRNDKIFYYLKINNWINVKSQKIDIKKIRINGDDINDLSEIDQYNIGDELIITMGFKAGIIKITE